MKNVGEVLYLVSVNADCGLRTADCGLWTRGKMQTEGKCRLQTRVKMQNEDYRLQTREKMREKTAVCARRNLLKFI